MTLRDIAGILKADVLTGADKLDNEAERFCGTDMMSEALAFNDHEAVLFTGLCNPQAIRTAEMLDVRCLIFVRGKHPTAEMLEMAEENGLVVFATPYSMFTACGMVYEAGGRGWTSEM